MRATVLAYHSHNIAGPLYELNDHVALATDLETIHWSGAQIVPLGEIVRALANGQIDGRGDSMVGISFDDGPLFDFEDFDHPQHGTQRGFLNILRDFRDRHGYHAQPGLHATSFVIASPDARRAMERHAGCGFTYLEKWLTDSWWNEAIDSGLFAIGNHSWDHVHEAVERLAVNLDVRNNFELVLNQRDADREIKDAAEFIRSRTEGRCNLFAFPFGHVNDFLVQKYLPLGERDHGMVAAFGTGGRQVLSGDSVWNIPRAVAGHHWKSPSELAQIVSG